MDSPDIVETGRILWTSCVSNQGGSRGQTRLLCGVRPFGKVAAGQIGSMGFGAIATGDDPGSTSCYQHVDRAFSSLVDMLSRVFYSHGRMCASHPWEVIVTFLTLSISMISMGATVGGTSRVCVWNNHCNLPENTSSVDVFMTFTRCIALIYIYHQFRRLYKLGSKYLVGIAGLFAVFSSLVFSSSVVNFLDGNFSELNKALPVFLFLIDLSKAGLLAQFALSASTQQEVRDNIAHGMAVLGPTMTLDTMVDTLAIGVGTLSGVKKLEEISCFACMSVIVNYIVFMTFFPACLSLVLELSRDRDEGRPVWQLSLTKVLQQEEEQKPNPVIQRVKMIMSAGLMLVHTVSRWPGSDGNSAIGHARSSVGGGSLPITRDPSILEYYFQRWLSVGPEEVMTLTFMCILVVKYVFFENREEFTDHPTSVLHQSKSNAVTQEFDNRPTKMPIENKCTHQMRKDSFGQPHVRLRRSSTYHAPSFFLGGSEPDIELVDKGSQTEDAVDADVKNGSVKSVSAPKDLDTCLQLLQTEGGPDKLTNEEILSIVRQTKKLPAYNLESVLGKTERAVAIRRDLIAELSKSGTSLEKLPYQNYDYSLVTGSCCENVVGYVPIPVGIAGPLLLDGKTYYIPMATTEGCLVASTNRGCRALSVSGGVRSRVTKDGMTRAPVVRLPSSPMADDLCHWLQQKENFALVKAAFDSTSRFARLIKIDTRVAAKYVYIRFDAVTGDAMGMNMVSKGTEVALAKLQEYFPEMEVISLSGNCCTDKKASAVNWVEGRGKSVVCEAEIPAKIVKDVLKTSVEKLVEVNTIKNLIGSAMAGSIGGFNAQAANIVTAIFIATGQDPAQNVCSSNCITILESSGDNLYISCTMPSIEVGTIGGGTVLSPQGACLDLLGVRGPASDEPGRHSKTLARIVCGTVLAGELSLLSALAAGHLVRSHMKHNRSTVNMCSEAPCKSRTS